MPDYYIGIDGGSTTSTGLLAKKDLEVLHRATAGCANYHLAGLRGAEKTLIALIESLSSAAGVSPKEIEGFCFALSGVSRAADFRNIEGLLREHLLLKKSKIIPDFEAALLGGTSKEEGLVVVSGTGSVVFGKNKSGKEKKVSGHGHLIGDPGSGYDLGIRSLRAVIAASEGRGEGTKLTAKILHEIGVKGEDEIVPWLYSIEDQKLAVARLAPTVISAAEEGDKVAGEITRSCALELAELAAFVVDYLGLTGQPLDIVLSGGVFENNPSYFRLMESVLSEKIPAAHPMRPENEPALGALVAVLGRPSPQPVRNPDQHPWAKAGHAPPE